MLLLPLLGSGDYRSELQSRLQTWLIAGLGELGEQAKPACVDTPAAAGLTWGWHFQPGAVLEPGAPVWPPSPVGSSGRAAVGSWEDGHRLPLWPLPSLLGRQRLLSWGRRLIGQVETSPFKPARANQGPARRPIQTRAAAGLPLPPPGHWRGAGAGEPAASVTGEQHRRLGLRALLAGGSRTPWSAPCTASPSGAGVPTRTCPSTSPPLVSAWDGWPPGLLLPALSARKGPHPRPRDR